MPEEIQEAVQIIRVALDGVVIAMKVGSFGIGQMQKVVAFLGGMLEYEKTLGKTSMRKLLLKGGDLQVFQFPEEELERVGKMAKKYGILYSVLPKVDREDGMREIVFHSEAVPRVNMMIQKMKVGQITGLDEFVTGGHETLLGKVTELFQRQQSRKETKREEAQKGDLSPGELVELSDRMRAVASSKNSSLSDVTIAKTLIAAENDHAVKTRVPGTWGDEVRYLWLEKEDVIEVYDGASLLTFLDHEKEYALYDRENNIAERVPGETLYRHYDKVDRSVRARYAKSRNRQTGMQELTEQTQAVKPKPKSERR
jgi:hypothetical protein